jgi:hypothetical protein
MTRRTRTALAAWVLVTSALAALGQASAGGPGTARPRDIADSLEVRVMCEDRISLMLRDPHARASFCAWDSTCSAIPGCRAFSMVEVYDAMGDDCEGVEPDSAEAAFADTAAVGAEAQASLQDDAAGGPPDGAGARRFVVLAPQAGDWDLEARVPANAGYVAATLWLDVRVAPLGGRSHVASTKWAELKPGGRVRSRLRVGRDGSVVLVRTVTRGEFVWNPAPRNQQ